MSQGDSPLVFVYLGDKPPQYMRAALTLAHRHAGVPIRILAPGSFSSTVPVGCEHIQTEHFYDHRGASAMLSGLVPVTPLHLDLWVRSTERFCVLHQYAKWAGLESFFHAELDCVPFSLDVLRETLVATGFSGLFMPYDHPNRVIASLLFVNDRTALATFLEWSIGAHYRSEMELLARFGRENPHLVVGLPTLEVLQAQHSFTGSGLRVIDPRATGCMVDAASL